MTATGALVLADRLVHEIDESVADSPGRGGRTTGVFSRIAEFQYQL